MRPWVGPGPVFVYEWLMATRRWQFYACGLGSWPRSSPGCRSPGCTCWKIIARARLFRPRRWRSSANALRHDRCDGTDAGAAGGAAATAGAVCLDKARGTLDHVLATDLSDAEIVLGKLGVRLVPRSAWSPASFP